MLAQVTKLHRNLVNPSIETVNVPGLGRRQISLRVLRISSKVQLAIQLWCTSVESHRLTHVDQQVAAEAHTRAIR